MHRSVDGNMGVAPTGMTNRVNLAGTVSDGGVHDTNGNVSSWSSTSPAAGETSSGYVTFTLELIDTTWIPIAVTSVPVPPGMDGCLLTAIGGGGGGGTAVGASFSASYGAGGGGGGGSVNAQKVPASFFGSTYSTTIGAQVTAATNGNSSILTSGTNNVTAGGGAKASTARQPSPERAARAAP